MYLYPLLILIPAQLCSARQMSSTIVSAPLVQFLGALSVLAAQPVRPYGFHRSHANYSLPIHSGMHQSQPVAFRLEIWELGASHLLLEPVVIARALGTVSLQTASLASASFL